MTTEFPYRLLGSPFRQFWSVHSTWIASDHLLVVSNSRFTEKYRRLYLREIQAIVLRPAARFILPIWWTLAVLALCIVRLIAARTGPAALAWASSAGALAIAAYIVYLALFRSCKLTVQTAIGQVSLHSASRIGPGRRIFEELTQQVSSLQGEMPPDWATIAEAETIPNPAPEITAAEPPSRDGRNAFLICAGAFLLVIADGVLSYLNHGNTDKKWLTVAGLLVTPAAAGLVTAALIRVRTGKRDQVPRVLFWIALVALGLANWGSSYVTGILVPFGAARPGVRDFFYYLNEVGELGAGLAGLGWMLATRSEYSTGPDTGLP